MKTIELPTGKIIIDEYSKGELETLSIGDYGKSKNIKADFLGFHNEVNGVPNGNCLPLSEKWVMTLSTQYGCAMKCTFCDAHQVKYAGNASFEDLKKQLILARNAFPDVAYTDRLNIHFARMGEPVFNNSNVFDFAHWLADKKIFQRDIKLRVETIHPVFTTMCPRVKETESVIKKWTAIKNYTFNGQAGLQLSINTTDDDARNKMFNGLAMTLSDIAKIKLEEPLGRKYCLNFAITDDTIIDEVKLKQLFDPEKWMVKITPIHNNNACAMNNMKTTDGYSSYTAYKSHEERLKAVGFDVLVFVPSLDEENSTITCGNAILGGSKIKL
jgi:23S rRNA (adenine2503-C2)-methyltransferase